MGDIKATMLKLVAGIMMFTVLAAGQAHAINEKYAGIVVDARTGKVLYEDRADARRYPASLTKMMTLYLTFEALEAGRINENTRVPVSRNAAAEVPSKLGLRVGSTITVEQVILALVTKSANDAATAIGEFLGGSEDKFAELMTQKARQLGMTRTVFQNAHGLPNPQQYTTARDMARLGIALREHFPDRYHYFSTRSFTYGGATYGNHNRLLGNVPGVDGIKTGFINASGFNLVASVRNDGRLVVATVMGGRSGASRNAHMRELLARYVPKASRGGGGGLIARGTVSPVLAANGWALPARGPVPAFRSRIETRLAAAYAPNSTAVERMAAYPTDGNQHVVGRDALAEILRSERPQAPVPSSAVGYAATSSKALVSGRSSAQEGIDDIVTASTGGGLGMGDVSEPSGWVVQVAAMPDRDAAMSYLARAQQKAGGTLADATPFTVAYDDGGTQLYRARFAGFDGKDAAWDACARLKKSGYGCWATEQ